MQSRRYRLAAGAKDESTQHFDASLRMSTEAGTEAHSIVDSTLGDIGLEAWRGSVQRSDPVSAHANLNIMSKVF